MMADEPDYILELRGVGGDAEEPATGDTRSANKWIGVHFECCSVYARIYRNGEGTAYVGHCPRCQRRVQVSIGPGGTSHRMFRAQ